MLFDFENDLTGRSVDANGNPVATPGLFPLLKQVQKQADKGEPEAYYLFHTKTVTKKATKKGAKPTKTTVHSVDRRSPANTLEELLKPFGGKAPANTEVLKVPANTIVVRCAAKDGCLGASAVSAGTYYYLM